MSEHHDHTTKPIEQAARASADVFLKANEAARDSARSGLETATQGFQHLTDQFTRVLGFSGLQSEELTRRSSENVQAMTEASAVITKGAQELSRELINFAQDRHAKNIDGIKRLAGCRSVQDLIAVQSDLLRDGVQELISANKRFAELSVRLANEAAQPFQNRATASRAA